MGAAALSGATIVTWLDASGVAGGFALHVPTQLHGP
jgi:hypothetical protein